MDARLLAGIWLLTPFFNIVEPTSFVTRQDDYERKLADNFVLPNPIDRFKRYDGAYPIANEHVNEAAMAKRRDYRQVDLEPMSTVEPTATMETKIPSERSDVTENDMVASSTGTYENSDAEAPDSKEKVIPLMTTDSSNLEVPELSSKNNTESSSDSNQAVESTTLLIDPRISLENRITELTPNGSAAVLIPEKEHTERIMALMPSKEHPHSGVQLSVRSLMEHTTLMIETEKYAIQLHRRYDNLPISEGDNYIWTKYSRAVVERFVLDFCRNYPHYSETEESIARWYNVEDYKSVYNMTLLQMQQLKPHLGVQIAAPVRRLGDLYRAIVDTPMGIVQSKCDISMSHWICEAYFVVHLAEISETCENIWSHAEVYLNALWGIRKAKGAKNAADVVLDELDSRLSNIESNDVRLLFDFIMQTLGDLIDKLKEPLLNEASYYNLVRREQNRGNLNCMNIDEQW